MKNKQRPDLPSPGKREEYEERVAIMECEGELSKEVAEANAWKLIFNNQYLRQTYLEFTIDSGNKNHEQSRDST